MKRPDITPGPWKWLGTKGNPKGLHYLSGPPYKAWVGACLGSDFCENKADAKAIAALPDLLDALETIYVWCQEENACHAAKSALTKAGYTFD